MANNFSGFHSRDERAFERKSENLPSPALAKQRRQISDTGFAESTKASGKPKTRRAAKKIPRRK
jgi:hypothetical protein